MGCWDVSAREAPMAAWHQHHTNPHTHRHKHPSININNKENRPSKGKSPKQQPHSRRPPVGCDSPSAAASRVCSASARATCFVGVMWCVRVRLSGCWMGGPHDARQPVAFVHHNQPHPPTEPRTKPSPKNHSPARSPWRRTPWQTPPPPPAPHRRRARPLAGRPGGICSSVGKLLV